MVSHVLMPQMGLEVTGGTVVTLVATVGEHVAEGTVLLEIETDKALTDVVAPRDGFLLGFTVAEGDEILVGATLAHLGDEAGEALDAEGRDGGAPVLVAVAEAPAAAEPVVALAPAPNGTQRLRAAPVARRAAHHHGLTLEAITGTGPRGRITLRDVEQAVAERVAAPVAPVAPVIAAVPADGELEPLSPTRRAIARRMTQSAAIPQFTLHRDIDLTCLQADKRRLTDAGPAKLSVNDLLVQALAETVRRHDILAAAYVAGATDDDAGQLRRTAGVHVGLAVAGDRGLLVPVLRRADERTLGELALERARLVALARSGRLDRADMTGATISLSSLAAFGVDRFNALLNPGETAILAVGRTREQLVARDGGIAVVPTATFCLTLDHRVADGAVGAAALATLAELLEGGMAWRA